MKDLQALVAACQNDLRSIGIVTGADVEWSVNTRAKCCWGQCETLGKGRYRISIAACLLEDDVADQAAKDTIVHELLHTVEGGHGHTGEWKRLARLVNIRLPSYTVTRVTAAERKGIDRPPPRYELQCTRCGKTAGRERMSDVVRFPNRYRCSCGGSLRRIR